VEFGGAKPLPITLTEEHVTTMAEHLSRLCEVLCNNEHYSYKDDIFSLTTTRIYSVARLYLNKQYISLKLGDLRYLLNMFHVIQNQLKSYTLALPDVINYVVAALGSNTYVEPASNASQFIPYYQLFEELKQLCKRAMLFFL
jgi:hypothetical protein